MHRRDFLRTTLVSAAAAGAAGAGLAGPAWSAEPTVHQAFEAARRTRPWLVGFESATADIEPSLLEIEGRWPAELAGRLWRNGPARHHRGDVRLHHWFDGDGMIQSFRIFGGRIEHRGRFVRTDRHVAEEAAGRFLSPTSGTEFPKLRPVTSSNTASPANTSVLSVGNELWALWEGGSPHALDPESLETRGLVRLSGPLSGAPFSAHPRTGEDKRIWNIGVLGVKLAVYRLSAIGKLEAFSIIDIPDVGSVHDFLLTDRSIVIVLPSADMMGTGESFFGRVRPRRDLPMQVIVLDRETLAVTRRSELPPGYWFHAGNGWEEADGTIRFDLVMIRDAGVIQQYRSFMRGDTDRPADNRGRTTIVTIDPRGRATMAQVPGDAEFPRIDPRVASRRHRLVATLEQTASTSPWYDAVRTVDIENGNVDRFIYGRDWLVEEHLFVPRPGSSREGDGWLLGTALHWPSHRTCLNVLNARRVADGPIGRAWLNRPLPLGLHGTFAAS